MTQPRAASKGAGGRRVYVSPKTGEAYQSVTAVLGKLDKPALVVSAANHAAQMAVEMLSSPRDYIDELAMPDAGLKRWIAGTARREWDKASNLGTAVHDAVSKALDRGGITSTEVTESQYGGFLAQAYEALLGLEILATERTVYNDDHGYAGTCDLFVRTPSGIVAPVDIKTGKRVYPEVALQLAGYAHHTSAVESTGEPADPIECNAGYVLHLHENKHAWYEADIERAFPVFLNLLAVQVDGTWIRKLKRAPGSV